MPHLAAVNLHDRRPSSISTSKISHVTENRNWFWFNLEGNQLTHPRPVQYKNVFKQSAFKSTTFYDWIRSFCFDISISSGHFRKCQKIHFTYYIINFVVYLLEFHAVLPIFFRFVRSGFYYLVYAFGVRLWASSHGVGAASMRFLNTFPEAFNYLLVLITEFLACFCGTCSRRIRKKTKQQKSS